MLTVQILRRRDRIRYNQLAQLAYGRAKGFTAETRAISWGPLDEVFYQLAVFEGEELLSYMRLEWINEAKDFTGRLKYSPSAEEVPCAYLNIAATQPHWQGKGLNGLLRFYSLKIIENWRMNYLFGSMVPGSPRIQVMKRMGYEFWQSSQPWTSGFQSAELPLIARLDMRKHLAGALEILEKENKILISEARLTFDPKAIKVRSQTQTSHIFNDYKKFFGNFNSQS